MFKWRTMCQVYDFGVAHSEWKCIFGLLRSLHRTIPHPLSQPAVFHISHLPWKELLSHIPWKQYCHNQSPCCNPGMDLYMNKARHQYRTWVEFHGTLNPDINSHADIQLWVRIHAFTTTININLNFHRISTQSWALTLTTSRQFTTHAIHLSGPEISTPHIIRFLWFSLPDWYVASTWARHNHTNFETIVHSQNGLVLTLSTRGTPEYTMVTIPSHVERQVDLGVTTTKFPIVWRPLWENPNKGLRSREPLASGILHK